MFLRLLAHEDKETAIAESIEALRQDDRHSAIHTVDSTSFQQVPGSPFAYWVSEKIRKLFVDLPQFENEERIVRQGLSTAADFRFISLWWEVPVNALCPPDAHPDNFNGSYCVLGNYQWFPFAKGGEYSPYYFNSHLVLNWRQDGQEMKAWAGSLYDNSPWSRIIKNVDCYFRSGLTYSRRSQRGLSFRVHPVGCIFSDKGPSIFIDNSSPIAVLGILNSVIFKSLVALQMAFGSYEVGVIRRTPIIDLSEEKSLRVGELSLDYVKLKRSVSSIDETSYFFYCPILLQTFGNSLIEQSRSWQERIDATEQRLLEYQQEIDDVAFELYGIEDDDRAAIESTLNRQSAIAEEDEDDESEEPQTTDARSLTAALISYLFGCTFGRWDIRYATGESPRPELPDPFAPLPIYSPGMLTPDSNLENYPLSIDSSSILVDDPDHSDDLIRRVQDAFAVIWQTSADAIEQEACELLNVKTLRDYFRKSGNGGFWQDHIKRYSKSRRKAPIYWLLQSSKKNYALWLYYPHLDKDILFKAQTQSVEPKLNLESNNLDRLLRQRTTLSGSTLKKLEKDIDKQEAIVADLQDFLEKLKRAANLHLDPDLNDGVVLNIAPLWELVPWSEAKRYWQDLMQGKYEWSSISKQLRAKGVIK